MCQGGPVLGGSQECYELFHLPLHVFPDGPVHEAVPTGVGGPCR